METFFATATLDALKNWSISSSFILSYLPEIIIATTAILVLAVDALTKTDKYKIGRDLATLGLFLAATFLALNIFNPSSDSEQIAAIGPSILTLYNPIFNNLFPFFFIGCAFLALRLLSYNKQSNPSISEPISTHLILIATAAAMALVRVQNFIAFFVLLETFTIILYALVGSNKKSEYALEASVKYLIAGGVSGGIMLFGIVLLYGGTAMNGINVTDTFGFLDIHNFIANNPDNKFALIGSIFVICGIAFKLGIFPMQFWIPDTYQGAPSHVTFFLATASKCTGFFLMVIMLSYVFFPLAKTLFPILLICTLISLIYATVTALKQQNVKRLLGLSGISHAAYLMIALIAVLKLTSVAPDINFFKLCSNVLFAYLGVYICTLFPIFTVMEHVPSENDALKTFDDYNNLIKRDRDLAGALTIALGSLAGIPPTVGFIAKLGLLIIVFAAELYLAAAIMLVCVVASVYYYFAWARTLFTSDNNNTEEKNIRPISFMTRLSLITFSLLLIVGCLVYWDIFSTCTQF